jgi:hypothetical protein
MSSKLFIIVGDCGLNGPWIEQVEKEPWTLEHMRAEESRRRADKSLGTTFQDFMQYEIDTETLELKEIDFA